MNIGLISDTHNRFHRDIVTAFRQVDLILHAGDIGAPSILHQLEQLAPVHAVRGNTDDPVRWNHLPKKLIIEVEKIKILIVHDIHSPRYFLHHPNAWSGGEKIDVVVFGHTHKFFARNIQGIYFLNPGSAASPRDPSKPTVGRLEIHRGKIGNLEKIELG